MIAPLFHINKTINAFGLDGVALNSCVAFGAKSRQKEKKRAPKCNNRNRSQLIDIPFCHCSLFFLRITFLSMHTSLKILDTHTHGRRRKQNAWTVLPCSRYWCQNKWAKTLAKRCTLNTWWTQYISLRWNFPVFFVFWMHTTYTVIWGPYCRRVTWSTKMLTPCMLARRLAVADRFPSRPDSRTPANQSFRPIGPIQCLHEEDEKKACQ